MAFVLTPTARSQRDRLVRHLLLFLLAALPVGAVLWALVNVWVAMAYVVGQTGLLMFGVRQQRTTLLRVDDAGVQYEALTFVLRANWSEVERVEEVDLPTGRTRALVLRRSGLRWSRDQEMRRQVLAKGWDRLVPIDEFDPSWPEGRLAETARRHRPDLFE